MSQEREKRRISNRLALAIGGVALSVAIAGGMAKCSAQEDQDDSTSTPGPTLSLEPYAFPSPIEIPTPLPTASEIVETKEGFVTLGQESNLSLSDLGISWTPDGHIPYISLSNGQKRYFTVGINKTYLVATPGQSLREALEENLLQPQSVREVLGRTQNPEYNYSGITSVFQLDTTNENHLTAILHQEEWAREGDGTGFRASVGVFESFDAGLTWENGRTIIRGDDFANPGERVSGAGQPNAIQIGEYLYIYHIDWSAQKIVNHSDQIYLARVKVTNGTIDNNIEYLTENGFSPDNSNLKPVIPVPQTFENAVYSALPSVSFNTYLNKYLCVFETNVGFAQTSSADGINWSEAELILRFPQPQSERKTMNEWLSYPTLVSDDTNSNDNTTGQNGRLYYSKGLWNTTSHQLFSREFEIIK